MPFFIVTSLAHANGDELRSFRPASVWKSIIIGSYPNREMLCSALEGAGIAIGNNAAAALVRLRLSDRPATRLNLVVRSAIELGIENEHTTLAEIATQAAEVGLRFCPAEVGPQLRLQYRDQPVGEFLRIAMLPIEIDHGSVGFIVGNGGAGQLLIAADGRLEARVPSIIRYVFVQSSSARGE